jgi:hypothetical protein
VAWHHDLLIARQQVVFVRVDEFVVRLLILRSIQRVGGQVQRHPQVRQDVQRAQAGFIRIVPDRIRAPPAPARTLTVDIDQLILIVQYVVGDAVDDAA